MFLHITLAKYLKDYKVEVFFNDGKRGVVDLSVALKGPVFEPLKDKSIFSQLFVDEELETIAWPNGADLAPEYLYYQALKTIRNYMTNSNSGDISPNKTWQDFRAGKLDYVGDCVGNRLACSA